MRETWYVTEAGDNVPPAECRRKDGMLTHKDGAKIAMRSPGVPRSRSVDVEAERAKKVPVEQPNPEVKTEDMQAEPKPAPVRRPGYKTRGKASE